MSQLINRRQHHVAAAAEFDPPPRPLRTLFLVTSMPVGGAETLLVDLVRRLDRSYFAPEVGCLKERGPLGEMLADEIPVHHGLLAHKYDLRIWPRLTRLLRQRQIDAVITVGAGDKMFWGRLAARRVRVPVVLSALHSTGWPDGVGRLNRLLTPITDAFVAVADLHGAHLIHNERFPAEKVIVIPNGVDTERFAPVPDVLTARRELGIGPTDPVITIVAALRPEKNHELFLEVARRVSQQFATAKFLVIGDGPRRKPLEQLARELSIESSVKFLGSRSDVPRLLSATDVFALTSHNEANPVSILEAMSVGRPVVTTNVGSIREVVVDGHNGSLVPGGDAELLTTRIVSLLEDPISCQEMGARARQTVVDGWSVDNMVRNYERLIAAIFARKHAHKQPRGKIVTVANADFAVAEPAPLAVS
ncbi:MAG TPA: glycosyltransferase [Lacipirellulaceae bacterium]|jgi:glycosyltransferase involved in cell wall biosynthesis